MDEYKDNEVEMTQPSKVYYTLTLADGSSFENLYVNGTNFVSADPVYQDQFIGKLQHVEVSDGENVMSYDNLSLAGLMEYEGEYYIALTPITRTQQMEANIDFLAMMTDVDLSDGGATLATYSARGSKSPNFEKVKKFYIIGTWPIHRVQSAVGKWITPDEFEEITGQTYE